MPVFETKCDNCEHEWEDIYFPGEALPTVCPECGAEGQVRKLISLPANGRVELYGHDLKSKLKEDGRKLKSDALKNENVLANLVGESKYHAHEVQRAEAKKERPKIKTSKTGKRIEQ